MTQTTKIVQAYIQELVNIVDLIQRADVRSQAAKAKYIALNPDLSNTNITSGQISAVNTFISDLNTLATSVVATTINTKDQPSHGTVALG